MLEQIVVAVVIAVLVGLLLSALLGPMLSSQGAGIPLLVVLGGFFTKYGWLLGFLIGLLVFFGGWSILGFGGHRPVG